MERETDPDGTGLAPTLWIVRHGESTWNALRLVQGQTAEPRLTPRGLMQARRAARQLAGRRVAAAYSSDLLRAVQTAQPIVVALGLDLVQDARLRERGFGVAEGTPADALLPEQSGIAGGRVADADAAPSGGESVRELCRRVGGFVDGLWDGTALERSPGDVVLVVHGGVVRAALAHLDGIGVDGMAWGPVGNGLVVGRPLPGGARPGEPVVPVPATAAVP